MSGLAALCGSVLAIDKSLDTSAEFAATWATEVTMAWQFPLSTNTQVTLGTSDSVFVAEDVTVAVSGNSAIFATGAGQQAIIAGTVVSDWDTILFWGSSYELATNHTVRIEYGADVRSFARFGAAVAFAGSNNDLRNEGYISSESYAVWYNSANLETDSQLVNRGTIEAVGTAIIRAEFQAETLRLVNSGTIIGSVAYGATTSGIVNIDQITNTGAITGNIDLFGGADIYDGRLGRLDGDVFGGAGADKLFGGIDADMLDGGADADLLNGGAGADVMKGGGGSDIYYVDNAGDVVDETGGDGIDRVYSTRTFSLADTVHTKGTVEHLTLTGTANLNGTGNGAANIILGNAGVNTLRGGNLNDTLTGVTGNDVLFGDAGADKLNGGKGMDTMSGGVDTVRDTFIFLFGDSAVQTTTVDKIRDWSVTDAIDTAFTGTSGPSTNYAEFATTAATIEGAAQDAEGLAGPDIVHGFLYNQAKDIGFLVSDLDRNFVFETGVVLFGAGTAGDFGFANLV